MTTLDVFEALAPHLEPLLYETFERRDLCILSTRIALDVCAYFGAEARAQAVRTMVYNRQFAAHVEAGSFNGDWSDGSYSVGTGFGLPESRAGIAWDGHLIAVGPDCFADFSIRQAERPERDIITGPAVVMGNYRGQPRWRVENRHGNVIEYEHIADRAYMKSPDWRDEKRRHKLAGTLIRRVRQSLGVVG